MKDAYQPAPPEHIRWFRMCRRCLRGIPNGQENCVCHAIGEMREHLAQMTDDQRREVLVETFSGYCGQCGRKLTLNQNTAGKEIVGDWRMCYCTSDE